MTTTFMPNSPALTTPRTSFDLTSEVNVDELPGTEIIAGAYRFLRVATTGEAHEVYTDGSDEPVAYARLRYGHFAVHLLNVDGALGSVVFIAEPDNTDNAFQSVDQRRTYLTRSTHYLNRALNEGGNL